MLISKVIRGSIELGAVLSAAYLFKREVADLTRIEGPSMQPTLNNREDGSVVLVNKVFIQSNLKVGDVVVLTSPVDPDKLICKRVTALGGHAIPTVSNDIFGSPRLFVIPAGHVWIEGDNPPLSHDSRAFGPVPAGLIKGRVMAVVWPFSDQAMVK